MMPMMDGITLTKFVKATPALKGIPVLILSAGSTAQHVIKGISAGARHYMTKPFSVKELIERVARALGD
jgi:DNA-binding response OmpR family regulator